MQGSFEFQVSSFIISSFREVAHGLMGPLDAFALSATVRSKLSFGSYASFVSLSEN